MNDCSPHQTVVSREVQQWQLLQLQQPAITREEYPDRILVRKIISPGPEKENCSSKIAFYGESIENAAAGKGKGNIEMKSQLSIRRGRVLLDRELKRNMWRMENRIIRGVRREKEWTDECCLAFFIPYQENDEEMGIFETKNK